MRLFNKFKPRSRVLTDSPIQVTFTGGLGAQIISTAIYWLLLEEGIDVIADFSYFNQRTHINQGNADCGLSIFPWQLDAFGIKRSDFNITSMSPLKPFRILDGYLKIALFLKAMSDMSPVLNIFSEYLDSYRQQIKSDHLPEGEYACVHIRRGDYLAVASHLISIESYISILKSISSEDLNLFVLSDSSLTEHEKILFSQLDLKKLYSSPILVLQKRPSQSWLRHLSLLLQIVSLVSLPDCFHRAVYIPVQWYRNLSKSRSDRNRRRLLNQLY